jgi:hypothetical protein
MVEVADPTTGETTTLVAEDRELSQWAGEPSGGGLHAEQAPIERVAEEPSNQHPRRILAGGGVGDPAGDLGGNRSISAQQRGLLVQSEHGGRGQDDLRFDAPLSRHQRRAPTATAIVSVATVGIGVAEGVEHGIVGGEIISSQARPGLTGPAGLRGRTNPAGFRGRPDCASGAVVTGTCWIDLCRSGVIVVRRRNGIGSRRRPISGQRLVDLLEHDRRDRTRVTVVTARQRVAFDLVIHVLRLLSRTAHPQRGGPVDLAGD